MGGHLAVRDGELLRVLSGVLDRGGDGGDRHVVLLQLRVERCPLEVRDKQCRLELHRDLQLPQRVVELGALQRAQSEMITAV